MQYKFKDFSTGKSGNKIDLVKLILGINFSEAMRTIVSDYNKFIKTSDYKEEKFIPQTRWEIDFINLRDWTVDDSNYWLSYRIGKTMLDTYNVRPIDYYNLVKQESNEVKKLKIGSKFCYGYFDKNGEVYKVYQPHSKKHKFFKAKPYLQGYDQLKFNQPYLVICSSLKRCNVS